MVESYKQSFSGRPDSYFSRAMNGEVEKSRLNVDYTIYDTLNAGELHPIECIEMLPNHSISINLSNVIRQNTVLTPTMGSLTAQIFAFFVPNRIVNESWKNVQGENTSGSWTAPAVSLAPLYSLTSGSGTLQIPVGSVADCYDIPTQAPIPVTLFRQCNDLPFRGYVEIYNEYFRDQNYQPPIPYSKLNVYNGFLEPLGTSIGLDGGTGQTVTNVPAGFPSDGSFANGAINKALYGEGAVYTNGVGSIIPARKTQFSALGSPLLVNKMHDYFTSVTPSSQRGASVFIPVTYSDSMVRVGTLPISSNLPTTIDNLTVWNRANSTPSPPGSPVYLTNSQLGQGVVAGTSYGPTVVLSPKNLGFYASQLQGEISVSDFRLASAIQQVYEIMARGGSRYRSIVTSFFGVDVVDPFYDIPCRLDENRLRFELDLFQTAQTSASQDGSPQGNLAAFGYTNNSGHLLHFTSVEHGYLHIFCVIRQHNIYPSFFRRSWLRMNQLDWYMPPLANISEQPIYRCEINPFDSESKAAFGYQEAWADYRFHPDRVKGFMRPGVEGSLSVWNYADEVDISLKNADGSWLRSNAKEVVDRTLAVSSSAAPQFKAQFHFSIVDELPMPVYSVPGLDVI